MMKSLGVVKCRLLLDYSYISANKWLKCGIFKFYYKLVFLFYYLDKHGIPSEDGMYKRIKILDNIMKPRIQMVPNYIEHTNVATSAVENDLLKNEIVKHLSLSQIKRANNDIMIVIEQDESLVVVATGIKDIGVSVCKMSITEEGSAICV